jgi:hypothetical protein
MSDHAARLGDTMRRIRGAANILAQPSDVCVLVAPPLGRARVWAAFHLPAAWLRAAGWDCDFLANGRRAGVSRREYERWIGTASRTAYQRLRRSGARVTGNARWRDVEAAVRDTSVRAIILIAHHVKDQVTDGVELLDGVIPAHALTSLLEERNARGPFPFAWLVCASQDRSNAIILTAPDVLPFSAPMRVELSAAIETCAAWIEGLDGTTPFDVAQQRAFARQFPSDTPEMSAPRMPAPEKPAPEKSVSETSS